MVLIEVVFFNVFNVFRLISASNEDDDGGDNASADELIALINSLNSTWTAGHNFPPGTSKKYLRGLAGTILEKDDSSNLERVVHDPDFIASLPESFDARQQWPDCPSLNHIRNQGPCGNGWAVAFAASITDRYCIWYNGTKQFYFSAQEVTSCVTTNDGCAGGKLEKSLLYFMKQGIVSGGDYGSEERCYPYEIPPIEGEIMPTPACKTICRPGYEKEYLQDKVYGYGGVIFNGEDFIKTELFKYGPMLSSFEVYEDFMNYKTGIYKHESGGFLGHHSVKIIGWGVEDGLKYWLVANSLGLNWGDDGFFKINRGTNECNFEGKNYHVRVARDQN